MPGQPPLIVLYFALKVACIAWRFLSNLRTLRKRGSRDDEHQRSAEVALKNSLNRQATRATLKEVAHGTDSGLLD